MPYTGGERIKMNNTDLKTLILALYNKYRNTEDKKASIQLGEETWSIKEIFGHLVDSAANNFQRFIRLQQEEELTFPGYGYNWIKLVPYNNYPFDSLIELWKHYNLLICHVIENIDEKALNHVWKTEEGDKTLEFLVDDYMVHLKYHIEHLEVRVKELETSGL